MRPYLKAEAAPIRSIDAISESRRAILVTLKQRGSATIAQLASSLQLTGEAVRQQLLQLQREGWIEPKVVRESADRARTGRPAAHYKLSDAGDHLFPKHYDALNVAVIDAVAQELGADAVVKVLARITEDRVNAVAPLVRELPLAERVVALKNWYLADDPYMDAQTAGGEYRLIERNCPFYNTAMHRPALCSVSVNALTRLLGVRVRRDEKFQQGDGRCVFHVFAQEPIDPATWQFRLESELDAAT